MRSQWLRWSSRGAKRRGDPVITDTPQEINISARIESVFGDNEKDNTKWNNNTNLSNKNNVNLVKVNCEGSEDNKALAKKYNVSAYPTVIVEANGNVANFNGNPKDGSKNGSLNTLMSNENIKNIKNGNAPKGVPFNLA